jgi:hypothetical protein
MEKLLAYVDNRIYYLILGNEKRIQITEFEYRKIKDTQLRELK